MGDADLPERSPEARGARLLAALRDWQGSSPAQTARTSGKLRAIDARRMVVEQAKGALMLHYGIDSHQAFAVLVRWSHAADVSVPILAQTLVDDLLGGPTSNTRRHPLVRWLDEQLSSDIDPHAPTPFVPGPRRSRTSRRASPRDR